MSLPQDLWWWVLSKILRKKSRSATAQREGAMNPLHLKQRIMTNKIELAIILLNCVFFFKSYIGVVFDFHGNIIPTSFLVHQYLSDCCQPCHSCRWKWQLMLKVTANVFRIAFAFSVVIFVDILLDRETDYLEMPFMFVNLFFLV